MNKKNLERTLEDTKALYRECIRSVIDHVDFIKMREDFLVSPRELSALQTTTERAIGHLNMINMLQEQLDKLKKENSYNLELINNHIENIQDIEKQMEEIKSVIKNALETAITIPGYVKHYLFEDDDDRTINIEIVFDNVENTMEYVSKYFNNFSWVEKTINNNQYYLGKMVKEDQVYNVSIFNGYKDNGIFLHLKVLIPYKAVYYHE